MSTELCRTDNVRTILNNIKEFELDHKLNNLYSSLIIENLFIANINCIEVKQTNRSKIFCLIGLDINQTISAYKDLIRYIELYIKSKYLPEQFFDFDHEELLKIRDILVHDEILLFTDLYDSDYLEIAMERLYILFNKIKRYLKYSCETFNYDLEIIDTYLSLENFCNFGINI